MNTRQKLTLGIAAIFMVTLTIVGVTYAYFLTRVEGDDNTDTLNVQTAEVGDIVYKDINGGELSIENALPGTEMYYQFSVANLGEQTQAFELFLTEARVDVNYVAPQTTIAGQTYTYGEYLHTANGLNTDQGVATGCYGTNMKMSEQLTDSTEDAAYKTLCFSGAKYNNFKITLYELDDTATTDVTVSGETGSKDFTVPAAQNAFDAETYDFENGTVVSVNNTQINYAAETGLATSAGAIKNMPIAGNTIRNFVLKVEYVKATDGAAEPEELIQNAENLASLKLKVNIR